MSEKDLKAFCCCVAGGNFFLKKNKLKEETPFFKNSPRCLWFGNLGVFFFSAWLVSCILKPALLTQNKGALTTFKGIWRAAVYTKLCSAFLQEREEGGNGGEEL